MATLYKALLSYILFLPFKLTNPGYHAVSLGHSSGSSLKVKGPGSKVKEQIFLLFVVVGKMFTKNTCFT
jgi:hypothetical protein